MALASELAVLVIALMLSGCVIQHGNGEVRIGPFESERERTIEIDHDGPVVPPLGKRKTPPDKEVGG